MDLPRTIGRIIEDNNPTIRDNKVRPTIINNREEEIGINRNKTIEGIPEEIKDIKTIINLNNHETTTRTTEKEEIETISRIIEETTTPTISSITMTLSNNLTEGIKDNKTEDHTNSSKEISVIPDHIIINGNRDPAVNCLHNLTSIHLKIKINILYHTDSNILHNYRDLLMI